MTHNKIVQGYLLGIISAACYGLNPLFAVHMYSEGIGVNSVLFYRYSISLILLFGIMLLQGTSFKVTKKEILPILGMGILFAFSSIFLFDSYNYMDVGIASTLLFVYPIMVALINAFLFHEKITLPTTLSLGLCCLGVVLLCHGGGNGTVNLWGVFLVLMSSLSYAIYIIAIKRSALSDYTPIKLTFYVILVGTLFLICKLNFLANLDPIHSYQSWGYAVGLSVFPTIISLVFMTLSVKYIGSTTAAILGSFEPVTGVAIGVIALHEILTSRIAIGIVLIIVSVTLIIGEKKIKNITQKHKF